jgi:hypothetical protein
MEAVTVYTALYDLDRASIDSRLFSSYVQWLESTIELFPGIIVFHDGALDSYDLQNCMLVNKPLEELRTFMLLGEVDSVLKTFKPSAPQDITFRLNSYALLQYAKFEFARLIEDPNESVMWVDAGISRFVNNVDLQTLNSSAEVLIRDNVDALFEIDVRNNLNLKSLSISDSTIGSCRRVISGGAFWIREGYLDVICTEIDMAMRKWLAAGVWDNEQVMLRKILPTLSGKILYIPQLRGVPGCVPRSLAAKRPKLYRHFFVLFTWLLRRSDLKEV